MGTTVIPVGTGPLPAASLIPGKQKSHRPIAAQLHRMGRRRITERRLKVLKTRLYGCASPRGRWNTEMQAGRGVPIRSAYLARQDKFALSTIESFDYNVSLK